MRIGSSPLTLPLPGSVERDPAVTRAPSRERDAQVVEETPEEVRRAEPRRRPSQRVDGAERIAKQKYSRVKDFHELPANNRLAISTYASTQRLANSDGAGELVGIDEIV